MTTNILSYNNKTNKNEKKLNYFQNEIKRWALNDLADPNTISVSTLADVSKTSFTNLTTFNPNNTNNSKISKQNDKPKKFKTLNHATAKTNPNLYQKNLTVERNMVKELLRISNQRYVTLVSLDFQKKNFMERQSSRGFFYPPTMDRSKSIASSLSRQTPVTPVSRSNSILKSDSIFESSIIDSSNKIRRSSNLSASMRLNIELAKLHEKDFNESLLSKRKAKKIPPSTIDVEQQFQETEFNNNNNNNNNNNQESKIIENDMPSIKGKKVTLIDKQNKGNDDDIKTKFSTHDIRYQNLLVSMKDVYKTPRAIQESPDDRVYKIIRQKSALNKDMNEDEIHSRDFNQRRPTLEQNLTNFERIISNF